MSMKIEMLMHADEMKCLRVESMTEEQKQTLINWAMRMFTLGQHIVAYIKDIKYDGRLIILDDGTRWAVDSIDSLTAEMWSTMDKVVVIDGEMFKIDELERVSVQQEYD